MKLQFLCVSVLAFVVGAPWPHAQAVEPEGDPTSGRALAQHMCSECHLVAGANADSNQRGPAFTELAKNTAITANHLRTFLRRPHGEMPNISLDQSDIGDLTAYILGLRE